MSRDSHLNLSLAGINWLIIGACTGSYQDILALHSRYPRLTVMQRGTKWTLQPPIQWVQEIVEVADQAGIPVFLKDNLEPLLLSQGSQDNRFWRDMRDKRGFEPLHAELRISFGFGW